MDWTFRSLLMTYQNWFYILYDIKVLLYWIGLYDFAELERTLMARGPGYSLCPVLS